jgi:molybdopterin-guanine dinucleotide biosynthesis protein A
METTILLLSGGASRRMGRSKALLPMENVDLLSWQEARFTAAGFPITSRLKDKFQGFFGPLAGIHSASLQNPSVQSWLVVPVDMPMLSTSTATQLIEHGQRLNKAVCFEDCPLPIFLPNTPELVALLEQWLADENGKRSVYALMKTLNGEWLESNAYKHELTNINTPEQWQTYLKGAEAS